VLGDVVTSFSIVCHVNSCTDASGQGGTITCN
jgi:hypothetical protein